MVLETTSCEQRNGGTHSVELGVSQGAELFGPCQCSSDQSPAKEAPKIKGPLDWVRVNRSVIDEFLRNEFLDQLTGCRGVTLIQKVSAKL